MNRVMVLATAGLVAALGVGVAGTAAAVPTAHGPKIVAKPDRVTVDKSTRLRGSGFKRHEKLTIWECSAKGWVVPRDPCNHRNAIDVRTDAHGRFVAKFKVLLCPAASSATVPGTSSKKCFIGVPTPEGVDTVVLVGAVRVTATRP